MVKTYDSHRDKTEARQADTRHMNLRVLIWSVGALVLIFAVMYGFYTLG